MARSPQLALVFVAALAGCDIIEVMEASYPNMAAAASRGGISSGWIPEWLPATATDLREVHYVPQLSQLTHGSLTMKIFQAATILVLATVLLTFSAISFLVSPRAVTLSLDSPSLFVEATAVAGVVLAAIAIRQFRAISRAISGTAPMAHGAAA